MPKMTSAQYDKKLYSHHHILNTNEQLEICKDIQKGNTLLLEEFLKKGDDINNSKIDIEYCAQISSPNINNGATLNLIFEGEANLLFAVINFSDSQMIAKTIDVLKKYNVDLNQSFTFQGSYNGMKPLDGTPLHMMSYYRDTQETVKKLLEAGANPNITNSSGMTALDMATQRDLKDNCKILQDYFKTHHIKPTPISYDAYLANKMKASAEIQAAADDHHNDLATNDHSNHDHNSDWVA